MARGDLQIQDLRVILLLSQQRGPITTTDISERLGIPMRTVQRIINAIEQIPLPLTRDSAGMGGGIRLVGDLALKVSLPSNLVELAALRAALEHMREVASGTVMCEALEQFVERTVAATTPTQRAFSERFTQMYRTRETPRSPVADPIPTVVHRALDENKVLAIEYASGNDVRPRRRDIEPAGMWTTSERTYVVGFDRSKKAMRTFALDRIRQARLSDTKFAPRGDFDIGAYFGTALGAFVGDGPADVELRLDAEAVRRLGKRRPTREARLVTRPDGGASLHFAAPLSDELLAWMVGLGPNVAAVHPPAAATFVREAFQARAAAQAKRPTARKPRAKAKKPISLPGPLARKMKRSR